MKLTTLLSTVVALALSLTAHAESSVTIAGVHNCCKKCDTGILNAVKSVKGAEAKTDGIFYNDLDRFEKFVENVLADDFITRMFDGFWVDDCRKKWMREAEFMLG